MGPAPQIGHFPPNWISPAILRLGVFGMSLREALKMCPFGQLASILIAIVASYCSRLSSRRLSFLATECAEHDVMPDF
jgi:hypothetical protein